MNHQLTDKILKNVKDVMTRERYWFESFEGWLQSDPVDWRLARQPRTEAQIITRVSEILQSQGMPVSQNEVAEALSSIQHALTVVQMNPTELGNSTRKAGLR